MWHVMHRQVSIGRPGSGYGFPEPSGPVPGSFTRCRRTTCSSHRGTDRATKGTVRRGIGPAKARRGAKVEEILVYGASWCPDCRRAKKFLADQRVPYSWHDIEGEPDGLRVVQDRNDGKNIIPTIVFPDGSHLAEPTNEELAQKLGLPRQAMQHVYDLIIVGGGPTGLTTAIYAARENLETLIVDSKGLGGQAGVTERLDNYPGFPEGIGGAELADRFVQQAERYGVEMLQAVSSRGSPRLGDDRRRRRARRRDGDRRPLPRPRGPPRDRLVVPAHGRRRGGRPDRRRRPLLRDVRRTLLQGLGRVDGDRWRQLRSGGRRLPHPVHRFGHDRRAWGPAPWVRSLQSKVLDHPTDDGDPAARREGVPEEGGRLRQARHGRARGSGLEGDRGAPSRGRVRVHRTRPEHGLPRGSASIWMRAASLPPTRRS